ncbi:hypothetical protein SBA7_1720002 [Candidatus Sulfotelmatobacter sp. SbA7]|nr:hypothetical protein SBA7_1720002 [Candidatus Sulfotelmatobacter sp. SbA7]
MSLRRLERHAEPSRKVNRRVNYKVNCQDASYVQDSAALPQPAPFRPRAGSIKFLTTEENYEINF